MSRCFRAPAPSEDVVIRRRILIAVLLAALFAVGWWSGRGGPGGDIYSNLDLFVEVLHKVEDYYVDPVEPEPLVQGALSGMLQTLDPYSQYLSPKEYGQLQDVTHGSFNGIGIEVGIRDHYPTVISPIEGSPAWEAGVQTGDVIVKVDGKTTVDYSIDDIARALRGEKGTSVTVTVSREGESAPRDFALVRREIAVNSVPYAFVTSDGIGYLRLARFSQESGSEARQALERLHKEGAKSLVLDLRRNPGGLLDQAVDVSEQFVPKGAQIVSTRGRAQGADRTFKAADARPETRWPMVVLVDEGSASAAEIVAGALQDLDRALIVGRTTFGKGSVQNVFPLRDGRAAVKLTTGLYYTPSGRSIHRPPTAASLAAANDDDDDDAAPDSAVANAAVPDTAGRPRFHTTSGRVVFGGGGITPDVAVPADTLGPVAREVERRGLALRFARRWEIAHRGTEFPAQPSPTIGREFQDYLVSERVAGADSITAESVRLERMARREIARRRGGEAEAARVGLEDDRAFARAADILRRARTTSEVFALAARPSTPGATPAPKPAKPATASKSAGTRRDS
jgi:carboxyl-terminal processing protease